MTRLKYDQEILEFMGLFSRLTPARLKDCFKEEGEYYCIVEEGDMGKAIGKNGVVIQHIKNRLQIPLRIIEYASSPEQFIRNIIYPVRVDTIEQQDNVFLITSPDYKSRSLLIGRDGRHIKMTTKIVKRFFPIEEVKVV